MIIKSEFKSVSLVEKDLILVLKSNEEKEIPISDLDAIHIKVNKEVSGYTYLYALLSFLIILFLFWYSLDKVLIISLIIMIVIIGVKLNGYRSYALKIRTINGDSFTQKVSATLRYETIDFINIVRKEIFIYRSTPENHVCDIHNKAERYQTFHSIKAKSFISKS
jgi:hypothetical protein|nr:hypothetical protein [uncultured Flavobacterium sp.]